MSELVPNTPQPAVLQIAPACCCQSNKQGGLMKILKRILVGVALFSLLANFYLAGIIALLMGAGGPEKTLVGGVPADFTNRQRIVVVEIKGGIDDTQAAYLSKTLNHLDASPPAALVLHIDSPGGGVSASDQMHHALMEFKKRHTDVKLIASFGGVAASGGYYIAMPCESIVCEPTGITGSIGVIAQIPALGGLAKKFGVEMNTVIADGSPHKADANDLFVSWHDDKGELTPAGKAAQEVLGGLLNSAYDRFHAVVEAGRLGKNGATKEEIAAFANGKIYTANDALKLKVVDAVGYLDDAIATARQAAGLKADAPVSVIRYEKGGLLSRITGACHGADGIDMTNLQPGQMRDMLNALGGVKLEYRMDLPVK